jgi:hypothetical protein
MEDKSDKKAEDAQPLGPALTLTDQNVYFGSHGDATATGRNPRRVTDYFKPVSGNPVVVSNAAVDTNANSKSDATEVVTTFDSDSDGDGVFRLLIGKGKDSHNGAIDSDIELEFDEVDEEKKLPPTKQRAESRRQNCKNPPVDDVVVILSDEEEATDNDSTDDDEDYESDEGKKSPPTNRKANSHGRHRQGAIVNNRPRKLPPVAATEVASNKDRSTASTPIISLGGFKTASREYKEYLHTQAIIRKGIPWSHRHYDHLRNRFSGHNFVLTTNGHETKAKKADIMKNAAQMYKKILNKLKQAQEQVTKKIADRNDNNPTAATRQHTATVPATAAPVAQDAEANPMYDETDDIGNVLNTFLAVLETRKEGAFNSKEDDVCEHGLKIKKFITHIEEGRVRLGL